MNAQHLFLLVKLLNVDGDGNRLLPGVTMAYHIAPITMGYQCPMIVNRRYVYINIPILQIAFNPVTSEVYTWSCNFELNPLL